MRRPVGFNLPPTSLVTTNGLLEFKNSKNKRRRRLGEAPILNAVAQLPPPPLPVQEPFAFECLPSVCDVFRDRHLREFYFNKISQVCVHLWLGVRTAAWRSCGTVRLFGLLNAPFSSLSFLPSRFPTSQAAPWEVWQGKPLCHRPLRPI